MEAQKQKAGWAGGASLECKVAEAGRPRGEEAREGRPRMTA